MSLEALPTSNDFPNFLIYDTISASPANLFFPNNNNNNDNSILNFSGGEFVSTQTSPDIKPGQQRRKRRRKPKSSKNKEEAESQRMTHIAVERNRRRQMNEHLSVLRSLMPDCYIQRGDQASIVGGAIDFVKELEQLLQSLEAQKRKVMERQERESQENKKNKSQLDLPPFSDFFTYPQYIRFHAPRDCYFPPPSPETHHRTPALADIEVTLIESHANLRILSPRRPRQLLKLVAGLHALSLTILHLNVTSLDFMVLYSLSTKVEEGCGLTTIEEIAAAVHHMLSLIEALTPAHSQ
ncbi:putative transcription factor bHLH family [Dioscorea sansibarensis]